MEHCSIQYPTNRNPAQSIQENAITVFGPRFYNSLPKYLRNIESVKTENFKFELDKFLELIPNEPKMPNYVTASGKATASSTSSLIWWVKEFTKVGESPTRPWRAVLAASKPLQVSKYHLTKVSARINKCIILMPPVAWGDQNSANVCPCACRKRRLIMGYKLSYTTDLLYAWTSMHAVRCTSLDSWALCCPGSGNILL